jgi:Protein of unknown function (DUF2786)
MEQAMTANREQVVEKIKALMSKTVDRGCTEAEAMAALDKARAWMDAYEISEAELQLTKEETAVLRREPPNSLDHHNIKFHLMGAVADFCSCEAAQRRKREGKAVTFCGLPSDAELAIWLLDSLAVFVQAELANHLIATLPPRSERRKVITGFVKGCCERISDRLHALRDQSAAAATSNGRELVAIKSAAVDAKMKECGIRVSGLYLGGQADGGSRKAGAAAGDRASFGRPVSGRNATPRLR